MLLNGSSAFVSNWGGKVPASATINCNKIIAKSVKLLRVLVQGLEVTILGIKPDTRAKGRLGHMANFDFGGSSLRSLTTLKTGSTCGANDVPRSF